MGKGGADDLSVALRIHKVEEKNQLPQSKSDLHMSIVHAHIQIHVI